MRNFIVYFELYGKKMKVKVLADSEELAKTQVQKDIKFHKLEKMKNEEFNDTMDILDNFLNILK